MPLQLPNGFTAIKDATEAESTVSLIGVLVSLDLPKTTRGPDMALDFTIQDDFTSGEVGGESSITCRLFRPTEDKFKTCGVGDVVILRRWKLQEYQFRMDAVGSRTCHMVVFPSHRIPVPGLSEAFQAGSQKLPHERTGGPPPTIPEQMAVIHLKHASKGAAPQVKQHATISASKAKTARKKSLIKDFQLDTFYDVCAQVVKFYYYQSGDRVDLKVTDYTPNEQMFYYPDPDLEKDFPVGDRPWSSPFGHMVLNITVYGANAAWIQENLGQDDFVFIRNMRAKLATNGMLEGALHEDKMNDSKVDIMLLKNEGEIEAINKRREEYEKKRETKTAFQALQNEPKQPSAKSAKAKKEAKKLKQQADKLAEVEELERAAREWEKGRGGINTNVTAAFPHMKLSTISEIIHNPHRTVTTTEKYTTFELPFINCRHRSRVRIVDVYPPEIKLFAHSTRDRKWNKHPKRQSSTGAHANEKWEWGFVLLLEDANVPRDTVAEKLRVVVNNEAAQFLLKMNAVDLTNQPKVLKKLEEKLFILWGNLMELKTELRDRGNDLPLPPGDNRLQNKPFDACIEEYGCEVPPTKDQHQFGYQRMYRLAQTAIVE
ncbi:uncharacterized protein J4E79_008252 [Alternaria viburni]|uniref:uncharacterized protein n=1 Tax=Alternaria viburni TaxID=566460 RepID=UPI0020C4FB80|nr:uncharacterized protein J4E79_008252 [Alternaria viburni]KAI4655187.1 hypothetical protein J4E79_008252 [Alternaria viburni]